MNRGGAYLPSDRKTKPWESKQYTQSWWDRTELHDSGLYRIELASDRRLFRSTKLSRKPDHAEILDFRGQGSLSEICFEDRRSNGSTCASRGNIESTIGSPDLNFPLLAPEYGHTFGQGTIDSPDIVREGYAPSYLGSTVYDGHTSAVPKQVENFDFGFESGPPSDFEWAAATAGPSPLNGQSSDLADYTSYLQNSWDTLSAIPSESFLAPMGDAPMATGSDLSTIHRHHQQTALLTTTSSVLDSGKVRKKKPKPKSRRYEPCLSSLDALCGFIKELNPAEMPFSEIAHELQDHEPIYRSNSSIGSSHLYTGPNSGSEVISTGASVPVERFCTEESPLLFVAPENESLGEECWEREGTPLRKRDRDETPGISTNRSTGHSRRRFADWGLTTF